MHGEIQDESTGEILSSILNHSEILPQQMYLPKTTSSDTRKFLLFFSSMELSHRFASLWM